MLKNSHKPGCDCFRCIGHHWSVMEIDSLRNYQCSSSSILDLATRLGLQPQQIKSQIYHQRHIEGRSKRREKKEEFDEDGGLERYCPHCKEWWPAIPEFFARLRKDGNTMQSWCNACHVEYHRERHPPKRIRLTPDEARLRKLERGRRWRANHRGIFKGKCGICGGQCKYGSKVCISCYRGILRSPKNPWRLRPLFREETHSEK